MPVRIERKLDFTYTTPKLAKERSTHDDFRPEDDYKIDVEFWQNGIKNKLTSTFFDEKSFDEILLKITKQALGM